MKNKKVSVWLFWDMLFNEYRKEGKNMQKYGYIRVSSKDQNPERQSLSLKEYEISKNNIYLDKVSGKNFERPMYQKMIKRLRQGDVIIIKSIDRLGRNYGEILEQWRYITKDIGANIRVIDMPLLNTDYDRENLTGVFIADLVLQILAYVAETERNFIKQRQAEGIAIAKAKGVVFGCPRMKIPDDFMHYYHGWKEGKFSLRESAEKLNMSHMTFYRRCKEIENQTKEEE